jgi:PTS system mannose-specific IIB component/fructoselysine and glucoselysine-specific PTS system IIB component
MPIVLLRVDERLIHGQVVVGWGNALHPDRIVVVDDDLAASTWEQELYLLGLPNDLEAVFETVDMASDLFGGWKRGGERVFVLTRDVSTMARLAEHGSLHGEEVNLGGIHYAPGRKAVLPYLYLSDEERAGVARLAAAGARVAARDVPGARRVDMDDLIDLKDGSP